MEMKTKCPVCDKEMDIHWTAEIDRCSKIMNLIWLGRDVEEMRKKSNG